MVKLTDAFEFIRQTSDVLLHVDWPTLEEEGISRETPVSLTLPNIPAEKALHLILQQVSAHSFSELDYAVNDGVVSVSTRVKVRPSTVMRVYDIRGLLAPITQPNIPPFRADGLAVEEPLAPETIAARDQVRAQAIEDIRLLIQETVGNFDDWEINGGPDTVRELNGNLIVKTTPEYHRRIVQLFEQISETFTDQVSIESRLLMVPTAVLARNGFLTDLKPIEAETPEEMNTAYAIIAPERSKRLIEATLAHRQGISFQAPRMTIFSGQRGYVTTGQQHTFVQEIQPASDPMSDPDITVGMVQDGVTVVVAGRLNSDRKGVVLNVDARLVLVDDDFDEQPFADVPDDLVIQTPRVQAWRARLPVGVPQDAALMIVGPELIGTPTAGKADGVSRRPIFILTPSIIKPATAPSFGEFPGVELPTH